VVRLQGFTPLPRDLKSRGEQAVCSDSERLTMLVVGEYMGWHRDLFLRQPERTRLNRRRRALIATLAALRCRVLAALDLAGDRQCVVDSLPVPVMGFHLVSGANNAGRWCEWSADFGSVITKKQTGAPWAVFGYKLHVLMTLGE